MVYFHWFEYSTHVFDIVHDLSALGVAHKIQVLGFLYVDKLFTIGS